MITIEICGGYFKHHTDQDIFDYFQAHYQDYFPNLVDRTLFARQGANLWHFQHRCIRKILAHTIGIFLNLLSGLKSLNFDGLLA